MADVSVVLSHFSAKPFEFDESFPYNGVSMRTGLFKPAGFWLSDEKQFGWKKWCEEESFGLQRLVHRVDFICDLSKWIHLKNAKDILKFTGDYQTTIPETELYVIDWERVKKDCSGILISPYSFSCRLRSDTMWYYGWDCASACVWDLSTIKEVK